MTMKRISHLSSPNDGYPHEPPSTNDFKKTILNHANNELSYHFVRVQEPVNTLQVVPDHLPELTERHQCLVPQSRKEVIRAAKITLSLILGEPSLLHIADPRVYIDTLLIFSSSHSLIFLL